MKKIILLISFLLCFILTIFIIGRNSTDNEKKSGEFLFRQEEIKMYLRKDESWYKSGEAIYLADFFLEDQLPDGGWRKDWYDSTVGGAWSKSTIDNYATTSQIIILARVYKNTNEAKYKEAALKGIDLLLDSQYDNGGWPQIFYEPNTYHARITYNDDAMIHVMELLQQVAYKTGDFVFIDDERSIKAKEAFQLGIKCILDTQIIVNGVKTAWAQQYDESTLLPVLGRAYEHPSITAYESASIVRFLKSIQNPDDEILDSINSAIDWFKKSELKGIKYVSVDDDMKVIQDLSADLLWARFYEIETNRPIFSDRDGVIVYDVSLISKSRRIGYSWYGTWPKDLLIDE